MASQAIIKVRLKRIVQSADSPAGRGGARPKYPRGLQPTAASSSELPCDRSCLPHRIGGDLVGCANGHCAGKGASALVQDFEAQIKSLRA